MKKKVEYTTVRAVKDCFAGTLELNGELGRLLCDMGFDASTDSERRVNVKLSVELDDNDPTAEREATLSVSEHIKRVRAAGKALHTAGEREGENPREFIS